MPSAVFVAPFLARATMRFVEAAVQIPEARVGLVTHEPLDKVPEGVRARLAAHWQVRDALDPDCLADGVRGIAGVLGGADALLGILEQAQTPIAIVRERLGIPGIDAVAAENFRDKHRMKDLLRAHGLPCAKHALVTRADEAHDFARRAGFPIVVKPPAGAGAKSTFRVEDETALRQAIQVAGAGAGKPVLLEEFLHGQEYSFDSIMVNGKLAWWSFSHYLPSPLEVLRNPWIQWCVMLPRSIDAPRFQKAKDVCAAAVKALGLHHGMSHMEWFLRADGSIAISEVGARPPGAQFTSLISYAHDRDFYRTWCELMILGRFVPPERKYAVGAAYFRGQGEGRVVKVHGLEEAQRELGELVVEAKLPVHGQPRSDGYEGDGYAIVRHPDTAVVEKALARLVKLVRVEMG